MFGKKPPALSSGKKRRILNVSIVEARNLVSCVKGGKSDPYIQCSLLDLGGKVIKAESFKTTQQTKTLEPKWNEQFEFGKSYDLDTTDELPSLQLAIFHKAAYTVSEVPMGEVNILLDSLDPKGAETSLWYPVEQTGRMKTVSGEVKVILNFSGPPTGADLEEGEEEVDPELEEMLEDRPPNELHITVLQGKKLMIADKGILGGGSSDPQVRVKVPMPDKKEAVQKTKYIRKTLNPNWNEKLIFPRVLDGSISIVVIVEDHNDIKPKADFLGKVAVQLNEFEDKKPHKKWYDLQSKTLVNDGKDRGKIELLFQWKHNVELFNKMQEEEEKRKNSTFTKLTNFGNRVGKLAGAIDESDSEAEDEDLEMAEETERPLDAEEQKKKDEEEEQRKQELSDIEIKDGDYQIQVHIIEARELKAENLDGTSDPITYVECFGQKQNTIVVKQVTSCVYDELFIFNMKNLDKEAFEDGLIRISCFDSGLMGAMNTMIGMYAIDATMVYTMNKDHELYRKWVPLIDDQDPEDTGVQGYMKISIQIIGPGEKIKIHDEEAEAAADLAKEAAAGGDLGSLILTTPTIRKEWQFIVVSVYKLEGLPVMDGKVALVSKAGTDAKTKLSFAGGKPIKTKPVTVKGDSRLLINPEINYELWYPVSIPTMTQLIKFSVWDHDKTGDELIGNINEKFNKLNKMNLRSTGLRWYNMYGAPEFKQESALGNLKKMGKGLAEKANRTFGELINFSDYYNNVPDKASTFKGRALLRFQIKDKRPEKKDKPEVKPFRLKIAKKLKTSDLPKTVQYTFQALVVMGTELPTFGTFQSQTLRVRISIGVHELSTNAAKYESGTCRWGQFLRSQPINLPEDPEQIPDIFIYLVREDLKAVCFKRLKPYVNAKTREFIGFDQNAEWHLLQEDKVLDALDTDVFPGNILLKLGFGPTEESEAKLEAWKHDLEMSKKGATYQVRVHLYQANNLPSADANGLCDPYLIVNFLGKQKRTKTVKKTVFPTYYETLVFDDVTLPEYKGFCYASQVNIRLYDYDLDGDDYLGTCAYGMDEAVVTQDPDEELPNPIFKEFFREVPKDGQGEVLMLVQLVPTLGRKITSIPRSIVPPTKKAFIELIIIGLRDMAPYNFQAMQSPFISIELLSFGTTYKCETAPSKRPDPSNPNYLEKIIMPVMLPINSIFTTPLQIKVRDLRLGGYLKPIVGVCQISLLHKLPWCPETYIAPQTDMFYQPGEDLGAGSGNPGIDGVLPGENDDAIALELMELKNKQKGEMSQDDFIASAEPINVNQFLEGRMQEDDTGAGVFGALNHIDISGNAKTKKKPEDAFADPDFSMDDGDQPPEWAINRKKLDDELETEFETTPFETYKLIRGHNSAFTSLKTVGKLKGLVRVMEDPDEPPLLSPELMDQLLLPKKYVVRLYCLTGLGLAAMDVNMFGQPANSDPYLVVSLGKKVFNDRDNYVEDVKNVDLYKMIEFEAELPGTSQLNIALMDRDMIGSDDLIGRTTIDLEDRWFDARWQKYGEENMITPGQDPTDKTKVRWQTKPVERRSIYVPAKSLPQGVIECWLDIMRPEVASTFPPDDVALPPTQMFEVRVVIWKTKNVPPMDSFEGMSDLFVKCWPEGCAPQETDTHWRCKKGKASFNWRLKFDVELGHSTRAMKFPYLHLQLWDRDIVKWNDCAGEGAISLKKYYKKAYKRNVALKLFETKKGIQAKRAKKNKNDPGRIQITDTTEDIPPEEEEEEKKEGEEGETDDEVKSPLISDDELADAPPPTNFTPEPATETLLPPRDEPDSDDDDDDDDTLNDTGMGAIPQNLSSKRFTGEEGKDELTEWEKIVVEEKRKKMKAEKEAKKKKEAAQAKRSAFFSRFMFWRKKEEKLDEEGKPLLEGDDEENQKSEEEQKEDEDSEMKDFITTIKNMTGLWDIDPDDSSWFHLTAKDKEDPTVVIPMGSICYSVQIWPKDKAIVMNAGAGRSEPNTNPFCPPPTGRLRFSWNPFVLGSELCGPVLCAKFFCCLICLGFLALMIFCQPALNIIINLIFVVCL